MPENKSVSLWARLSGGWAALTGEHKLRLQILFIVVPALLIAGLAFYGWLAQLGAGYRGAERVLEALFRALRALTVGDIYTDSQNWGGDYRLQLARWVGIFFTALALARLVMLAFERRIGRIRAALRDKHAVVLGESDWAAAFVSMWGRRGRPATWHRTDAHLSQGGAGLNVERPPLLTSPFLSASLAGADRIIVAEADPATTADNAFNLARRFPSTHVFAVIDRPWLADRLAHIDDLNPAPGARRNLLSVVSPSASAARAVLLRHPPFLQAAARGLKVPHVLVVDATPLGIALVVDLINSMLATEAGEPLITVLTPQAKAREEEFRHRRPGLIETGTRGVDLCFIEGDPCRLDQAAVATLRARVAAAPICQVFITGSGSDAIEAAVALQDVSEREDLFEAPILAHMANEAGLRPSGCGVLPNGLATFGGLEDVLSTSGMLDASPDALPRRYHEAYRTFARGTRADHDWDDLAEMFRIANRRAIAHLPAKLFSAGFDLGDWLAKPDRDPFTLPRLAAGQRLFRNADELMMLARLEHDRWCLDRRLEGWVAGAQRCDRRRVHHDLAPFDDLPDTQKAYDLKFIAWLEGWLMEEAGDLERDPHRPIGPETPAVREEVLRLAPELEARL